MCTHVVPAKIYYRVFTVLIVLLAATVAAAYVQMGRVNVMAALTIAVTKVVLIILYFMHVRYSSHLVWLFVCAGFFWLGILLALTLTDFSTRAWSLP